MSQILRIHKSCVIMLIRLYSAHRHQTYYDVLRISPNSTQKEIRQAFIKLSKEMHPDTSGKKDHHEFVKLSEAYNVLSKESTRKDYDMTLRTDRMNFHTDPSRRNDEKPYEPVYTSYREWEIHMARGTRPNYNKQGRPMMHGSPRSVSWVFGFIILGICIQIILVQRSLTFRREVLLERSREYSEEYKKVRAAASRLSREEQIKGMKQRLNTSSSGDDMS